MLSFSIVCFSEIQLTDTADTESIIVRHYCTDIRDISYLTYT